jgi:phospholipid/cholesterol/gamma-HCH transport system ATP-binding protein
MAAPILRVSGLAVGYGADAVQRGLSFTVQRGAIFAIMGGSGCGKSTVLKALTGLLRPREGRVIFAETDYWALPDDRRAVIGRRFGVLFQGAALWRSMTAGGNIALPLEMFTKLDRHAIAALVRLKLSLAGLDGIERKMPAELSGGMAKRLGLARALALDPDILFLDEPSAGLDPISAARLDALIRVLRDGLGVTVVLVSHDLPSLLAICDDGIFLDAITHSASAHGSPRAMRANSADKTVQAFMSRGGDGG